MKQDLLKNKIYDPEGQYQRVLALLAGDSAQISAKGMREECSKSLRDSMRKKQEILHIW